VRPPSVVRCETTADPADMWEAASDFLLADPVLNNVLVTNIGTRRDGLVTDPAPATYAVVRDQVGTIIGAAMRTPPHMVVLSPMPPVAVAPLAEAMAALCPDAAGVVGPAATAEAFAAAWAECTGAAVAVELHERIYRLDAVVPPPAPPGAWRAASPADRDAVLAMLAAFDAEMGLRRTDGAAEIDWRIAEGRAHLWVDEAPASFACTTRPGGGVVRIGPVYTPPARRRRGYAAALVAAVSQRALDEGASCCSLYTDLANPTSNAIYMAVGYRPVADVTAYRLTSAGGTTAG
jgi:predicted GNAT family acetyltransferase